jgi:hypothetical protein
MAQPKLQLQFTQSPVLRYGLAMLSVSVALGGALHESVNAIKELGVFWAVINEPPPGGVRK